MSLDESPGLKRGVLAALDTAGVLTKVKAFMYAQVWSILHHREMSEVDPLLQAQNFISVEDLKVLAYLVKWLTDKGMVNTLTVLELESGQPFKDLPDVDNYELLSSSGTRSPGQSDVGAAFSDMSMEPISEYASPVRNMVSPDNRGTHETVIPVQPVKGSAFSFKQDNPFGEDQSQDTNLTISNASMAPGVSLGPDETSSSKHSPNRITDFSFKYNERSLVRNSMLSPDTAAHVRQMNSQGKITVNLNSSPAKAQERSITSGPEQPSDFVTELIVPDPQIGEHEHRGDEAEGEGEFLNASQDMVDSLIVPDRNVKTVAELQEEGIHDRTDPNYLESFTSEVSNSTGQSRQATLNLLDAVGREMQVFDSIVTPGDSTVQSGLARSTLNIMQVRSNPNLAKADSGLMGDSTISAISETAPVDSAFTAGKVAAQLIGMPAGTTSILTNAAPDINGLQDISSIHTGADDTISTRPQPSLNSELMTGNDFSAGIVLERAPLQQQEQTAPGEFTLDNYGDLSLGVTITNEGVSANNFNYENIQEDEFGDFEF